MDKDLLIKLQKEKSHKMLSDANDMVEQKRWDIAANRYYYACYHMLQGLFISRGMSAKSHDGSLTHLGQDFILSGQVDKKFGRFFARMVQLRHKADYNSIADVTENEVLEMAPLSIEFVKQIEAII
ncbi:MAG: HEPN domain-containing protein [Prevotella sp.]|nr:HEPN domain-containing protein [Prevotella sp.]